MYIRIRWKEIAILYSIIYLCTFDLWDNVFGRIFKYIFLLLMCAGTVLFLVGFLSKKNKFDKNYTMTLTLYFLLEVIFVCGCLAISNSQQRSLAFYQYVFYLTLIPAIIYYIKGVDIDKIITCFKFIGVIISCLAIYEVFSGRYLIENSFSGISYDGSRVLRAMVFSGSFLTLGTIIAVISVVCFYSFLTKKTIFNFSVFIINVIGLFMTSSRGPLVAFVISTFVIYIYIGGRANAVRVLKVLVTAIVIGSILYLITNYLSKSNETIEYYLFRVKSIFDWSDNSASNTSRIYYWMYSINTIFSNYNWIFGIGLASTGARSMALWGGFVTESGVLKRMVELGIFGASIYYAFLCVFIRNCYMQGKKTGNKYIALCFGVIVCILVEDTILQVTEEISVTFMLFLFICIMMNAFYHKEREYNSKEIKLKT